jgi:hypothetical protein
MLVRRVVGRSMLPGLLPGSVVVAVRRSPQVNDIVIASMNKREVIKRVRGVSGDSYYLVGDNTSESTDSRDLGMVAKQDILGVVMMKFHPVFSTSAPDVASKKFHFIPYAAVALVSVMLLAQLFAFEDFVPLMQSITGHDMGGKWLAASIVLVELFSLPFWLRMSLSRLARLFSVILTILLPLLWLAIIIAHPSGSIGMLGSKVTIDSGLGNLLLAVVLSALSLASFYVLNGTSVLRGLKRK